MTVPWNYITVLLGPYYGHDGAPYFYRPEAVVSPYLTVSQTGINYSIVENYVWSVVGALVKFVARPAADPGQWDWGLIFGHVTNDVILKIGIAFRDSSVVFP